jgi:hypothetical protein
MDNSLGQSSFSQGINQWLKLYTGLPKLPAPCLLVTVGKPNRANTGLHQLLQTLRPRITGRLDIGLA